MSHGNLCIGGRSVGGPAGRVYFIAEAGSNHDRDLEQAKRLIDVAAEAGADAVKFQTFRADRLYPRRAGQTDYLKTPRSIFDVIRDLEMPIEWIAILARHCEHRGVHFLSTPFDEKSADALDPYVPAFKVASYEMTHYTLVQHIARKGKPVIISTGTANLEEVRELVRAVRAVGCEDLVLLQCTAKYPAPLESLNVRTLATLAAEFDVPVGLSDHSREPLPGPLAAVALGASVIEKHFTLANDLPGPDHAYALEPADLADVIRKVREVERCLGSGRKEIQPQEQELRLFARRSLFTTQAVSAGGRLQRGNVSVLRCGKLPYGLHPGRYVSVLGRVAARDLGEEETLREEDLGPLSLTAGAVRLVPLAHEHTDAVVRWRGRQEIASQFFSDRPPTRSEHENWLAALQLRSDRTEFMIHAAGLGPVGTVGLSSIDFGADEAEYGIMVGEPQARGRGIALAASVAILDHAFTDLGLSYVRLQMFSDNQAARRLYDKLGFHLASEQPASRMKEGVLREVTAMTLDARAWNGLRSTLLASFAEREPS